MPTYTIRGVEVPFPYEAYDCQIEYMSTALAALQAGENALLESPTGTGKTLCLLCATLAWRQSAIKAVEDKLKQAQAAPHSSILVQGLRTAWAEEQLAAAQGSPQAAARAQASLPVVVYASRTHSQLSQVQRELGRAGFKVRSAVLSSRAQTCLNPAVKTLPQSTAGRVCRGLMQKRACRHYLGVDPYLKAEPEAGLAVRDLEELVRLGTQRTLCPFVLSRQLATDADVLFVPYNYLIEPAKRRSLSVPWERAVLVFDEAHNLESACSDAASFDLPAATLGAAVEELGTAAELALLRDEGGQGSQKKEDKSAAETSAELRQAQIILRKLEQAIAELDVPKTGRTEPGAFLFQLFAKVRLTPETWPLLASAFETALDVLTQNASEAGRSSGSRSSSYRLHAVSDALSLAFETCPPPGEGGDSRDSSAASPSAHLGYRVHVHLEQSRSQGFPLPTLSFWCFAPGQALKALQQLSVRSVLLTSGTLSPLGSFAAELGLPFRHRLENPHVIDPSQVWVGVVPRGPTGAALNSSFLTRDSPEYRRDLGAAVVNFARIVPDGMLVFFASYGLLTSAVEAWQASPAGGGSVWDRIARHKSPIVEPRDAALFGQAVADFKAKLDAPGSKGAVLFAVCRGKASEGIDFSDRAGRAVLLTGIPYATKTDAKVRLKQEVLNESLRQRRQPKRAPGEDRAQDAGLSGDAWYVQQALRAVNQAMGRVIRHRHDYGAVVLLDERYRSPGTQAQLSRWLRDRVVVHDSYGSAAGSLSKFFRERERLGAARRAEAREEEDKGGTCGAFQSATVVVSGVNPAAPQGPSPGSFARSLPPAVDLADVVGLGAAPVGRAASVLEEIQSSGFAERLEQTQRELASDRRKPWEAGSAARARAPPPPPPPVPASVREALEAAAAAPLPGKDENVPPKADGVKAYLALLERELPKPAMDAVRRALQAFKAARDRGALMDSVAAALGSDPARRPLLEGFRVFLPAGAQPDWDARLGASACAERALELAMSARPAGEERRAAAQEAARVPLPGGARLAVATERFFSIRALPEDGAAPRASAARSASSSWPSSGRAAGAKASPKTGGSASAPRPAAARPAPLPTPSAPRPTPSSRAPPRPCRSPTPTTAFACPVCRSEVASKPQRGPCGHVACSACWTKACALMKCALCKRAVRRSQVDDC